MTEDENTTWQWIEHRPERGGLFIEPTILGVRFRCPCCGYPTLRERGRYNICFLCNWEDDGQDDPRADEVWGGPNANYSLTHARNNFRKYFLMYDPEDNERPARTQNTTQLNAKKAIVAALDAMRRDDGVSDADLGQIVLANYTILRRELHNSVTPQS